MKTGFQTGLQSKFENSDCPEDTSPETLWDQMKSAILQASEEVLGLTTKNWFDENNQGIQELLTKKRSSHQANLTQPSCPMRRVAFRPICSILQRKLREIQNEWWTNIAKRTQQYVDLGDYRGFFKPSRQVRLTGSRVPSTVQMGKCFLQTRSLFWLVGLSTFNPSLALTVSSWTQQLSASPSNYSRQNWINYPLWKKLPKP